METEKTEELPSPRESQGRVLRHRDRSAVQRLHFSRGVFHFSGFRASSTLSCWSPPGREGWSLLRGQAELRGAARCTRYLAAHRYPGFGLFVYPHVLCDCMAQGLPLK